MGGSAISKLNQRYSIRKQDWIETRREKQMSLWKNKLMIEELEEHQFIVNDSAEFKTCIEIFEIRYQSKYLIASRYLNICQENSLCSNIVKGSVYIERIPIKLSDINEIPFPDILHFYSQCFKGFGQLYQKFGYFQITEDLIGANQMARVKVWMNSNFSSFHKQINFIKPQGSQVLMIQKLMQLLDLNTNQQQSESVYLYISKRNPLTFVDANRYLEQYSISKRITIPDYSNCLLAMIQVLKSHSISDLAFNNPFTGSSSKQKILKQDISLSSRVGQVSRFTLNGNSNTRAITPPPVLMRARQFSNFKYPPQAIIKPFQQNKIGTRIVGHQLNQNSYFKTQQKPQNIPTTPHSVHSHSLSLPKTLSIKRFQSVQKQSIQIKVNPQNYIKPTYYPIANASPMKNSNILPNQTLLYSPKNKSIKINHQITSKQSPTILRTKQLVPTASNSLLNNQYYSNYTQSKITKFTANSSGSSLANRFNQIKSSPNKSSFRQPNTSVFKETTLSSTPIQRMNRFNTPQNNNNKFSFAAIIQTPKQPIVFVNQKENSSFVISDQLGKIQINTIQEQHQPIINQYGFGTYYDIQIIHSKPNSKTQLSHNQYISQNSNQSIKPKFPTPQIINKRQNYTIYHTQQQSQSNIEQVQPRGNIYVKKKVPSLEYIHSIRSQSSIPYQNVKGSYQFNQMNHYNNTQNNNYNFNSYNNLPNLNAMCMKQTTSSRQAMFQTYLSQQSKSRQLNGKSLDKIIQSPVQFRITRQDYNNSNPYNYEYLSTFSNLDNFKINNQDYSPNIYKGIAMESYEDKDKYQPNTKQQTQQSKDDDYQEYCIKINNQIKNNDI